MVVARPHGNAPFYEASRTEAGNAQRQNTKSMNKTYKIEPRQREALADMLRSAKNRKQEELESSSGFSRYAIAKELASEEGADPVVKQIIEIRPKIKELQIQLERAQEDLKRLGFEYDSSGVDLHYSASTSLRKKFADAVRDRYAPIEKSLRVYDLAIADIWTVDSNDDASKVIEGLI